MAATYGTPGSWLDERDAERLLEQGFPRRVDVRDRMWAVCEHEWDFEHACFSRVGYRNSNLAPKGSATVYIRLTPAEIAQGGPAYVRQMVRWTIENAT